MRKHLTSKSAANMSSDSVNISGAEGFFGLVPIEQMINSNDGVQCHSIIQQSNGMLLIKQIISCMLIDSCNRITSLLKTLVTIYVYDLQSSKVLVALSNMQTFFFLSNEVVLGLDVGFKGVQVLPLVLLHVSCHALQDVIG